MHILFESMVIAVKLFLYSGDTDDEDEEDDEYDDDLRWGLPPSSPKEDGMLFVVTMLLLLQYSYCTI